MEQNGEWWTPREAVDSYGIESWGKRYSRVGFGGTVEVLPDQRLEGSIDLLEIVEKLQVTLPVHALGPGEPYYPGAFLVGAYQEVLGDLHNLFGDTHALLIDTDGEGGWVIEELIEGDTVREVPRYVQFDPDALMAAFRRGVERAQWERRLALDEGRQLVRFYQEGLNGSTYLEEG